MIFLGKNDLFIFHNSNLDMDLYVFLSWVCHEIFIVYSLPCWDNFWMSH